jgi:hypothetical protein
MEAIVADFSDELRPRVPELAQRLPQHVTAADVLDVQTSGEHVLATIRYAGNNDEVTIRSRWQVVDGRPVIVAVEPAR